MQQSLIYDNPCRVNIDLIPIEKIPKAPVTTKRKLTKFDRRHRQQITTVELVGALFTSLKRNNLPPKSITCITAILMRVGRIKATLFHGERPVLAQRHYKKHQRMFAKLKDTVMFEYGEEVSLDFYNAVMMMCFEVVDTVRGEKQYVDDWCRVAAMIETVYAHMEGLGENDRYITDGVNMKHKIERILEAA